MKRILTLFTLLLFVSLSLLYTDLVKKGNASESLPTSHQFKTINANPEFASLVGIKLYPIEKATFIN